MTVIIPIVFIAGMASAMFYVTPFLSFAALSAEAEDMAAPVDLSAVATPASLAAHTSSSAAAPFLSGCALVVHDLSVPCLSCAQVEIM